MPRTPRRSWSGPCVVGASLLVALCAWFVLADPLPKGPLLFSVTATHGVDTVDLAILPVLALALWLVWPRRQRRRAEPITRPHPSAEPFRVLVVCTANRVRSPIAASLFARHLATAGVHAEVRSAGTNAEPGLPARAEATAALDGIADHRSARLTAAMIEEADLVVGMERHHVREAVLLVPDPLDALDRVFTLKSLARLGREVGARDASEPLADWLARAAARRSLADLTGRAEEDDVPDPLGGGARAHARVTAELDHAIAEVVDLAWCSERALDGSRAGLSATRSTSS